MKDTMPFRRYIFKVGVFNEVKEGALFCEPEFFVMLERQYRRG